METVKIEALRDLVNRSSVGIAHGPLHLIRVLFCPLKVKSQR